MTIPVLLTVTAVGSPLLYVVPEDLVMSIPDPSEKVPHTLNGSLSPAESNCIMAGLADMPEIWADGSTSKSRRCDFPDCWPDLPPIAFR